MNWLQLSLLSVFCTSVVSNCLGEQTSKHSNGSKEFTFNLAHPDVSEDYLVISKKNLSSSTTVVLPAGDNRMTKLVDGSETLMTLYPDQLFTKLVFSPSREPKLCSVSYLKKNVLVTRRFCKLFGWNELTVDDYNYLMFDLTKEPVGVPLDFSNVDPLKFTKKLNKYGNLSFYNIKCVKGFKVNKLYDGSDLLWESDEPSFDSALLSVNTNPRLLSVSFLDNNLFTFKTFTSFDNKFVEVDRKEFLYILNNMTESVDPNMVLDLDSLDTSYFETSFDSLNGVDFVSVYPKNGYNITKVVVGTYVLWESDENHRCLNASFTLSSEPRLYNLLTSCTDSDHVEDRSLFFMSHNSSFYSMPEEEYKDKLLSFTTDLPFEAYDKDPQNLSQYKRSEPINLELFVEMSAKDNFSTFMYTPPEESYVTRLTFGNHLVWVALKGERLDKLLFFKDGNKYFTQLTLTNQENEVYTLYFQNSKSYFKHLTKGSKVSEEEDNWLWIPAPDFFNNVSLSQLVKSYVSLDFTTRPDSGIYQHKKSLFNKPNKVGKISVETYATYPSFSVTSLFQGFKHLWSSSNGEELLGVALYGAYKDSSSDLTNSDGFKDLSNKNDADLKDPLNEDFNSLNNVKNKQEYTLAELFVKKGDKLKRKYYSLQDGSWKSKEASEFNKLYKKL